MLSLYESVFFVEHTSILRVSGGDIQYGERIPHFHDLAAR